MRGFRWKFKTCRNKINRDVSETVCAFLNLHGGTILLGVQDDGTLQGIEPDAVTQIKKDFVTSVNNPLKLTPPTYLSVDVVELDGKFLLRIYVPESSQVHRCNGRIFDRNEDGDLDITDHTTQVAHLYQRKQATFSENKVYPWIQVTDLRPELIEKCRRYVRINRDNHPWADMDDLQLLKSAQLYQEDPETKQNGVTLAGVMLFAPYPKKPVIGAFFREIDHADELGSGMRKMMMYGKKYGGSDPQLIERGCFSHDHQCAGIWRETREDG